MKINKEQVFRKNIRTVAIYNALFYENKNKQKALISITIGDEKLTSLFKLRREFIAQIRKILKRVAYKGEKIAYFSNIELGASNGELNKKFNPHIHFQFFYNNFKPIRLALKEIETKYTFSNCDIQVADKPTAYMSYIIKDYIADNYNEELEIQKKKLGMKMPIYTSSRKSISNYMIKYIYNYYKKNSPRMWSVLAARKRYDLILKQIKNGKIRIEALSDSIPSGYKAVKNIQIKIIIWILLQIKTS